LQMFELKEKIRQKTSELEKLAGNMELNLLTRVLKERNELLNFIPTECDEVGYMVEFLREILERDALIRARIGVNYRRIGEKIETLRSEKIAAVKYSNFMN
jgi:hypothetical protein